MPGKWYKPLLLLVILGLPVLLYLFLQGYGTNQYQVPIYYPSGIDDPIADCPQTTGAYQLPDTIIIAGPTTIGNLYQFKEQLTVFAFLDNNCGHLRSAVDQLAAIANRYRKDDRVGIMALKADTLNDYGLWELAGSRYGFDQQNWSSGLIDNPELISCTFNLSLADCQAAKQVVLVDGKLRIRGYFNSQDQEEMDRLFTEIEILLRNGEDT